METSFGSAEILSQEPFIELLTFERSGRTHQHHQYETFVVTKGNGIVRRGDEDITVAPGSLVTIPPQTEHWMIPNEGEKLIGFLWYHDQDSKASTPTSKNFQ